MNNLIRSALFLFLALSFLFSGCAKPNYQDPAPNVFQADPADKPSDGNSDPSTPPPPMTCAIFLQQKQLCVNMKWKNNLIKAYELNSFEFYYYRIENPDEPVDAGMATSVILWMPSMSHGSSPVKIKKEANGKFTVTDVYFVMPGPWEIRFQLPDHITPVDQVYVALHVQ